MRVLPMREQETSDLFVLSASTEILHSEREQFDMSANPVSPGSGGTASEMAECG